uniref:Uncharacterized protein n=1 Tax=Apteryx owenii TaxID=8824 RepID=A0A8B9SFH4_APTOW
MSLTSLKTILPASLTESGGKLGLMLLRHLHSCLWSCQASFYWVFKRKRKKNDILQGSTQHSSLQTSLPLATQKTKRNKQTKTSFHLAPNSVFHSSSMYPNVNSLVKDWSLPKKFQSGIFFH